MTNLLRNTLNFVPVVRESPPAPSRAELEAVRAEVRTLRREIDVLVRKIAAFPEPWRSGWARPARRQIASVIYDQETCEITSYNSSGEKIEEFSGRFDTVGLRALANTPRGVEWTLTGDDCLAPTLRLPKVHISPA